VQRVFGSRSYPITPKEHGVDFLMGIATSVRSPRQASILRVRAEIIKAVRDFFDERGFTLTDPPIPDTRACEGTRTLFPVDLLDEQAYLTQSGQLYIDPHHGAWARSTPSANVPPEKSKDPPPPSRNSGWWTGTRYATLDELEWT